MRCGERSWSRLRDDHDDRDGRDDRDVADEPPPHARDDERVDRRREARAREERADDAEHVGERDERDVPDLEHALLLLHDHRVQEGRGRQPRDQRGVLDRVPAPEAAPADLLVGPLGAQQHADAEREPGHERPAPHGLQPASVGAAADERGHRERERDREADVAEVEQRRVREHVRVLQRGHEAGAVARHLGDGVERARDEARREREERAGAAEEGDEVRHQLARAAPVLVGDERREPAEHEQPEQQRALLARPERRDQVRLGHLARGVLGDAREAEVVAHDGRHEHARGDGDADEAAGERAPRTRDQALVVHARARRAPRSAHTPPRAARAAARRGRATPSGAHWVGATDVEEYFDGHFVLSVSWRALKAVPCTLPSIRIARPSRKADGTDPW